MNFREVLSLLLFFFLGLLGALLAGLLVFGSIIFNQRSPLFQFLSYGVVGSLVFPLFQSQRLKQALFISLLLFFSLLIMLDFRFVVPHLLFFSGLLLAVYFYSQRICSHFRFPPAIRPLIFALILGGSFLAAGIILPLFYPSGNPFLLLKNALVGVLLGLGMATGWEIAFSIQANKLP